MKPVHTQRVVWITGAAGGLGQRLGEEFTTQGWRVAAAYHSSTQHKETEYLWPVQTDVTDRNQISETAGHILERWGRIDALINNAGLSADQLSWQTSEDLWDRVLDVNLKGAYLCSQAAARAMMKQHCGHIVNISSFAARNGHRGLAAYVAAKAGLVGLTESLAKELGSRQICVNAVMPGVLKTRMTAHLNEQALEEFASLNALGKLNSVDEVAGFIAFLVTMRNVSGQMFQLDSRIAPWT